MGPYQTQGDYKRCACGELLIAAEEVAYGVCLKCVNDIMEDNYIMEDAY
jgi:hypothetical protein